MKFAWVVPCPRCGSGIGQECTRKSGQIVNGTSHVVRQILALARPLPEHAPATGIQPQNFITGADNESHRIHDPWPAPAPRRVKDEQASAFAGRAR